MHTPGPWHAQEMGSEGWSIFFVRQGFVRTLTSNLRKDDARLIAAAPDLLEFAHQAFDFFRTYRNETGDDGPLSWAARVIAKAQGHD